MNHNLWSFGVQTLDFGLWTPESGVEMSLTFGSWVLMEGLSILVLGDSGSGGVKSFLFLILK